MREHLNVPALLEPMDHVEGRCLRDAKCFGRLGIGRRNAVLRLKASQNGQCFRLALGQTGWLCTEPAGYLPRQRWAHCNNPVRAFLNALGHVTAPEAIRA